MTGHRTKAKDAKIVGWAKKSLAWSSAVLLGLLVVGVAYQAVATQMDRRASGLDRRRAPAGYVPTEPGDLPEPLREQAGSLYYQAHHLVAEFDRVGAMPQAMDQARRTGNLGGVPLAVVSASDFGAEPLTNSRAAAVRHDQESRSLQQHLWHHSSNSTRRVVEGSTDDSLVLNSYDARQTNEEILRLVETVRRDQPLKRTLRVQKKGVTS